MPAYVYRAGTGEYLGPLTGRYSQGTRPDGTPWPDCLLYAHSAMQSVGINADLAELRDAPPPRKDAKGRAR
jgi:hypothetical protein